MRITVSQIAKTGPLEVWREVIFEFEAGEYSPSELCRIADDAVTGHDNEEPTPVPLTLDTPNTVETSTTTGE